MEQLCQRPMTIGEIFKKNWQIFKENFAQLVLLNFVVFLPFFILFCLILIIIGGIWINNPNYFAPNIAQSTIYDWIGVALKFVVILFLLTAIGICSMYFNVYGIFRIYDEALQGKKLDWKSSLKGSKLPVLFFLVLMIPFNGLVGGISLFLGALNLMIPIFFIPQIMIAYGAKTFTLVALPSIALEHKNPITGFLRSCSLIWRNIGQVLAVYLIYIVIAIVSCGALFMMVFIPLLGWFFSVGLGIFQTFDPTIFINPWFILSLAIFLTLGLFIGFILFNFYYGLQVLLLYDLRVRNEG